MANYLSEDLDPTFDALASPVRRAMLRRLAEGERSVAELAEPFDLAKPTISKHLKSLEDAGLIRRRKEGRRRLISVNPEPIETAMNELAEIRRFWLERFDALDALLEEESREMKHESPKKGGTNP